MKYQKPKILLIDMDEATYERLNSMGLNVRFGTFGRPYRCDTAHGTQRVFMCPNSELPDLLEQEIVIIDTKSPAVDEFPTYLQDFVPNDVGMYTNDPSHIANPRPLAMLTSQTWIDRILTHAGVVLVFVELQLFKHIVIYKNYHTARYDRSVGFSTDPLSEPHNLSFSGHLEQREMRYGFDSGKEVRLSDTPCQFQDVLAQYIHNVAFNCTFDPDCSRDLNGGRPRFIPLLLNKYYIGNYDAHKLISSSVLDGGMSEVIPDACREMS